MIDGFYWLKDCVGGRGGIGGAEGGFAGAVSDGRGDVAVDGTTDHARVQ